MDVVDFSNEFRTSDAKASALDSLMAKTVERAVNPDADEPKGPDLTAPSPAPARPEKPVETPEPAVADSPSLESDSPEVVESEQQPEDAAPGGEATPATGPQADAGNPKLYAGKYQRVEDLEQGYRAASAEVKRIQQSASAEANELRTQLTQAQQRLAEVLAQHPPEFEKLNQEQQAFYRYQADLTQGRFTPEELFAADLRNYEDRTKQEAKHLADAREAARGQFLQAIDKLDPAVQEQTWDALERSGVNWRTFFDSASPQLALQMGNQLLELQADRVRLQRENERLKAGQKQIATEARHAGKEEQRQSIATKRASGTAAAKASSVPQKSPGEAPKQRSIIDELLDFTRDKNRFEVIEG